MAQIVTSLNGGDTTTAIGPSCVSDIEACSVRPRPPPLCGSKKVASIAEVAEEAIRDFGLSAVIRSDLSMAFADGGFGRFLASRGVAPPVLSRAVGVGSRREPIPGQSSAMFPDNKKMPRNDPRYRKFTLRCNISRIIRISCTRRTECDL